MKPALKLKTFQIGSPPKPGQGLRISVTRFPPRGVPQARWRRDGYFDVWMPILGPSAELFKRIRSAVDRRGDPAKLFDAYERELMRNAEVRGAVHLLAEIARRTPISIGCFCSDETRCHRSRLKAVIEREAGRE